MVVSWLMLMMMNQAEPRCSSSSAEVLVIVLLHRLWGNGCGWVLGTRCYSSAESPVAAILLANRLMLSDHPLSGTKEEKSVGSLGLLWDFCGGLLWDFVK